MVLPGPGAYPPYGHEAEIRSVAFSLDGQSVATAAWDDTARIWNLRSPKEPAVLRHPVFNVESAVFSPDGRLVLTMAGDAIARLWDARAGTEVPALTSTQRVAVAAFGSGGRTIVTVDRNGVVRERDVSSGAEVSTHQVQRPKSDRSVGAFQSARAISADGRTLLVGWSNAKVGLWNLASRRIIISVLDGASFYSARFSPDGQWLLTQEYDERAASVWKSASGRKHATLRHQRGIRAATFSPDGRTIATAAQGGEIRLWDADSGNELQVLGVHTDAGAVVFTPDGRSVATAANDIRIWPVMPRGQALIEFGCAQVPWSLSAEQRERFGVTIEWCTPEVSNALRGNVRVR